MTNRTRIVVVGGGFAGLESAFLLRSKLGDRVDVTLVSDRDRFLFKPNTIYIPFGGSEESLLIPLDGPTDKKGIRFVHGQLDSLDKERRVVRAGGRELEYDDLILATGAGMRPDEVPGLAEHAETIWTADEMARLGERLRGLVDASGDGVRRTILFVVPPNNKCAGPLYEIALMTETWLRKRGVRDRFRLIWTTYEPSYIAAFGPKLHEVVIDEFASRGIEGHTGWRVATVGPWAVHYEGGEGVGYDLLVAFPPYVAAVDYSRYGLPSDERGFLACEPGSPPRRRRGADLRAGGCRRLPGEAGVSRLFAGRRCRRGHRRPG
jgi:sulfide:quinone oxidoreductase